jgi:hypothetical protein
MSEGDAVTLTSRGQKIQRTETVGSARDVTIPLLDPAKLSEHYGMANRDRIERHTATIALPVDLSEDLWNREMAGALKTFIDKTEQMGWTFHTRTGAMYERGRFPAVDLASGIADPTKEEWHWHAFFSFDNPKPIRIQVDPKLVGDLKPATEPARRFQSA